MTNNILNLKFGILLGRRFWEEIRFSCEEHLWAVWQGPTEGGCSRASAYDWESVDKLTLSFLLLSLSSSEQTQTMDWDVLPWSHHREHGHCPAGPTPSGLGQRWSRPLCRYWHWPSYSPWLTGPGSADDDSLLHSTGFTECLHFTQWPTFFVLICLRSLHNVTCSVQNVALLNWTVFENKNSPPCQH